MATAQREWTWKSVVLKQWQHGDAVTQLIAEQDAAAADPDQTTRLRFGRVFTRSDGQTLMNNAITVTGGNVDAFLAALPEAVDLIRKFAVKLPRPAVKTPAAAKQAPTDAEAKLASMFGTQPATIQTGVGPMPLAPEYAKQAPAPAATNSKKAKRAY